MVIEWSLRMRRLAVTIGITTALLVMGAASASASVHVVRTKVVRPHQHVRHERRFTPIAHPDPAQVPRIEDLEQARWGGPTLHHRSWCESGNRWWASSAGVLGIIAASWWRNIAWPASPRGVKLHRDFQRWRPVRRLTVWSDGSRVWHRIGRVRQRVRLVRRGHLPEHATRDNAWAEIRVGQRVVSGDGPWASWECSL